MPEPKTAADQDLDAESCPSPSAEEIFVGALAEMMEDAGVDPLGESSPSDRSLPSQVIPPWFLKLSDHI